MCNGNEPGHQNIHKILSTCLFRYRDTFDDIAVKAAACNDFVTVLIP